MVEQHPAPPATTAGGSTWARAISSSRTATCATCPRPKFTPPTTVSRTRTSHCTERWGKTRNKMPIADCRMYNDGCPSPFVRFVVHSVRPLIEAVHGFPRSQSDFPPHPRRWALAPVCLLLTLGAINSGLNLTYLLASLAISILFAGILFPIWSGRGLDCRGISPTRPSPANRSITLSSSPAAAAAPRPRGHSRSAPRAGGRPQFLLRIPRRARSASPASAHRCRAARTPCRRWSGAAASLRTGGVRRAQQRRHELLVYPARGVLLSDAVSPSRPRAGGGAP